MFVVSFDYIILDEKKKESLKALDGRTCGQNNLKQIVTLKKEVSVMVFDEWFEGRDGVEDGAKINVSLGDGESVIISVQ